jgi:hypothetical protein
MSANPFQPNYNRDTKSTLFFDVSLSETEKLSRAEYIATIEYLRKTIRFLEHFATVLEKVAREDADVKVEAA